MLLCLAVTIGFRDTKRMGNAAGTSVHIKVFLVLAYYKHIYVCVRVLQSASFLFIVCILQLCHSFLAYNTKMSCNYDLDAL